MVFGPKSCWPPNEGSRHVPGAPRVVPHHRLCFSVVAGVRLRLDLLLEDLRLCVLAQADDVARDEAATGFADAPANDDRLLEHDVARHMDEQAEGAMAARELRELVVARQAGAAIDQARAAAPAVAQHVGERVDYHAGGAAPWRQAARHDAVLGDLDERGRSLRNDVDSSGSRHRSPCTARSLTSARRAGRRTA